LTERSDAPVCWHPVIGIDLGTTSCAMSAWSDEGVTVIPGPTGGSALPALVGQNRAGQIVVGRPPADPDTVITASCTAVPRNASACRFISISRKAQISCGW
jgi:molecular chaperone DnaK